MVTALQDLGIAARGVEIIASGFLGVVEWPVGLLANGGDACNSDVGGGDDEDGGGDDDEDGSGGDEDDGDDNDDGEALAAL